MRRVVALFLPTFLTDQSGAGKAALTRELPMVRLFRKATGALWLLLTMLRAAEARLRHDGCPCADADAWASSKMQILKKTRPRLRALRCGARAIRHSLRHGLPIQYLLTLPAPRIFSRARQRF